VQNNHAEQLQRIYSCSVEELPSHRTRYERLYEFFAACYRTGSAAFVVRAPGRVNLIGEHTDYNGYPVLPMAIDRDVVLVLSPRAESTITLRNENPRYEERTFSAELPLTPYRQGDWGNYVKAAVHGLLEAGIIDAKKVAGFQAVVGGTIPDTGGLSSSSAMVVASALAFLAANRTDVDYMTLADLLARAERYVGSEGGGMDQAVSLLAGAGKALRIDFFPLRVEPVALPEGITFVVCNSLIRAPKSESAQHAYNCRVAECRLAGALLSNAIGQKMGKNIRVVRLADLSADKLGVGHDELHQLALESIGDHPLSMKAIAQRLGRSVESVERDYCTSQSGSVLKEPAEGFRVWNRYRHVVTEAERVGLTIKAFKDGDIDEVGRLMNQSHASCRDDYEISCPELDVLVSVGREKGALGARLTGAGFGGCTVHAVPSGRVDEFVRGVAAEYYHGYVKKDKGRQFISYDKLDDVIFPCRATAGAGVWPADALNG
jgi:N-acetylgalactosamine kinase